MAPEASVARMASLEHCTMAANWEIATSASSSDVRSAFSACFRSLISSSRVMI